MTSDTEHSKGHNEGSQGLDQYGVWVKQKKTAEDMPSNEHAQTDNYDEQLIDLDGQEGDDMGMDIESFETLDLDDFLSTSSDVTEEPEVQKKEPLEEESDYPLASLEDIEADDSLNDITEISLESPKDMLTRGSEHSDQPQEPTEDLNLTVEVDDDLSPDDIGGDAQLHDVSIFQDLSDDEDDVSADGGEDSDPIFFDHVEGSPTAEAPQKTLANDTATAILMQIAQELSSIKTEIIGLKTQFNATAVQTPETSPEAPAPSEPESTSAGFFADDDADETIALTGDELNNILITADFTEDKEPEDNFEIPEVLNLEENSSESLSSTDEEALQDESLNEITPAPVSEVTEDLSYLDEEKEATPTEDEAPEEDFADDSVEEDVMETDEADEGDDDLDNSYFVEVPSDQEEEITPPDVFDEDELEADDGAEDKEIEPIEELILPDEQELDVPAQTSAVEGEALDTTECSLEDTPIVCDPEQGICTDLSIEEDEVQDEPNTEVTEDACPLVQESDETVETAEELEETLPEVAEEMPEEANEIPVADDSLEDVPVADSEPAPDELKPLEAVEAEEKPSCKGCATEEPVSEPLNMQISGEAQADTAVTGKLKEDIKMVLSCMDKLLESLPEKKIEEFARSQYFETYRRLFDELGIS